MLKDKLLVNLLKLFCAVFLIKSYVMIYNSTVRYQGLMNQVEVMLESVSCLMPTYSILFLNIALKMRCLETRLLFYS